MPIGLYNEKFRRPNIAFTDLLKKGAGGAFRERGEYASFMFRALVIAMDVEGGKLETPDGTPYQRGGGGDLRIPYQGPSGEWVNPPSAGGGGGTDWSPGGAPLHVMVRSSKNVLIAEYDIAPTRGPVNPPNSIRARIIGNNMDQFTSDDDLRCYWPILPGIANVSAGEMAYVVFEDESYTHGLWLARVPTNDADQTACQILQGETVQAIQAGAAAAFNDAASPEIARTPAGSPIKDPQRLSKIFLR